MNTDNIEKYILIGQKDVDWYEECKNVFVYIFGKEKLELVTKLFAATSINTSLKSNITLFRKAFYEIENNLPVGDYLPNIKNQIIKIRNGEELSGRKIRAFQKAMFGCPNSVVVDIWLLRAFDMDKKYFRKKSGLMRSRGATDKEYTLIENYVRCKAVKIGIEPRQLSSILWAGARIDATGDRNTHYKEILINKMVNLFNVI